jgi:hypothetical protein
VYVIIHADERGVGAGENGVSGVRGRKGSRIETFVVGPDVANGERLQWIVEGGKYKASYLLPDEHGETEGLFISEVSFLNINILSVNERPLSYHDRL